MVHLGSSAPNCTVHLGASELMRTRIKVLIRPLACQLAQEPWIDLGANVEDESAPPSTDVAKHYRTMPIVGIKWDAPAGGVAPRSPTRADKDEAAALL